MKDSGVEWIGQCPAHWKINRTKYVFQIVKRIAGEEGYDILSVTQKGLRIKDITNNEGQIANSYKNYQFVYPNDFVMNHMDLLTGWIDISKFFGVTSPDYRVFQLCNTDDNSLIYFKYVMQNCYLNRIFYSMGQGVSNMGRWRLSTSVFCNFSIPVPPHHEQESIASFLDTKCVEIDALVEDIKAEITTLEESKKSFITEIVTKGLNPDVELKDSGVAWIGQCPAHWRVDKLKYHLKRDESRNPGNMPVLSLYREYGIIPKDSRDDNHNITSEDVSKYKYVRSGDFVINKMKAWQGSVAVSGYEGIVSPAYYVYRFTDSVIIRLYLHYLLRGCYRDEFMRLSKGIRVGQWDLPSEALGNLPIVIPPCSEQEAIASFLDTKCAEIDAIISSKKEQLTTLDEYKKSLIYEYVTGKKEVPQL